ncbi:cytosolic carboxypeptidase 6 isoform X3 [Dendrobates tinctorius]|uniref:cytosolic carboxypeptidase 6 isoform X3 n=1 Tax=Dendrobates tinctorius TaxID=92724 RepID=UPI003CCA0EFD
MTTNMAESSGSAETGNGIGNEAAMCRNVSKLIVLPPVFNGQPKRGNLIFDACFESGNLGRVDYISEFEYDLFIRPDTCNPRFRVWFNFTVENVKEYQRVIFNIVNFSKTKSLYRDGMSPVVKSTSRPNWQRLPSKNVYYYRCPDHRKNYVMSFAFCFDREDDVYQFAYCFPYTYTRLQHYLENLDRMNLDYVHRELLGLSVHLCCLLPVFQDLCYVSACVLQDISSLPAVSMTSAMCLPASSRTSPVHLWSPGPLLCVCLHLAGCLQSTCSLQDLCYESARIFQDVSSPPAVSRTSTSCFKTAVYLQYLRNLCYLFPSCLICLLSMAHGLSLLSTSVSLTMSAPLRTIENFGIVGGSRCRITSDQQVTLHRVDTSSCRLWLTYFFCVGGNNPLFYFHYFI